MPTLHNNNSSMKKRNRSNNNNNNHNNYNNNNNNITSNGGLHINNNNNNNTITPLTNSINHYQTINGGNGGNNNIKTSLSSYDTSLLSSSSSSTNYITSAATTSTTITSINYNNINSLINNNNNNNNGGNTILTLKQQQQLDRNQYLMKLTKEQLKIECRKRGQKTTGTKMELLQRLGYKMSHHQQVAAAAAAAASSSSSNVNYRGGQKHNNNNNNNNNNKMMAQSGGLSPNGSAPPSSFVRKQSARDREKERNEREKLVLWRHPIQTIKYCILECMTLLQTYGKKLSEHKILIAIFLLLISITIGFYHVPGRHQIFIDVIRTNIWFITYWLGLGVLSSVGLGTGLHTFLLYLGPHIASVTLAAYECNSLNFPQPPYPDEIICPDTIEPGFIPTIWKIMTKVRAEAFLWGAGTALGELPPYFMAKAARLSGYDPDDAEDLQEFEELQKKKEQGGNLNLLDRAKLGMERLVEKVGFFGILACASVPNPLFDLAGLTCGHFLVPFWTFFGATLIGKAIIKMHIQKIFVIIAFNEMLIEKAVHILGIIPVIGKRLQEPFKSFLQNQKTKLHRTSNKNINGVKESGNLIAYCFEKLVILMVIYFVISIINSLAQNFHKRVHKKGGKVHRKIAKD